MEKLEKWLEEIDEELEGAEHYAKKSCEARQHKDEHAASMYAEMAVQEMHHAENLQKMMREHIEGMPEEHRHMLEPMVAWSERRLEHWEEKIKHKMKR